MLSNDKEILLLLVWFLFLIPYTSWNDKHYSIRIKIPKCFNILFLNQVKNRTVPLISFVTMVQFYISLIVLTLISIVNKGMNLNDLLFYYFVVPYLFIVIPIIIIIDVIIGYKKTRSQKELNEKKYIVNPKVKNKKKSKSKINKN